MFQTEEKKNQSHPALATIHNRVPGMESHKDAFYDRGLHISAEIFLNHGGVSAQNRRNANLAPKNDVLVHLT